MSLATSRSATIAGGKRLLFASTGTKDPAASDVLYIEGLAAPHTVNTMPEETLLAFADHGRVGEPLDDDGDAAGAGLARYEEGLVKEGVGAGAAAFAAFVKTDITHDQLVERIVQLAEKLDEPRKTN